MSALLFLSLFLLLVIDAALFFLLGGAFGFSRKIKHLEKMGYTITQNDE